MNRENRVLATQAVLSGLALLLLLGVAARALQSPAVDEPAYEPEITKTQAAAVANDRAESQQRDAQTRRQAAAAASDRSSAPLDLHGLESQNKPERVTGTIVKSGTDLMLKSDSGTIYRLDSTEKARPFEGMPVTVDGDVEGARRLIHVAEIRAVSS